MNLEYNILNILTLFGALQGFILCFFIYQKKRVNKLSVNFFILFLFSLAFYNLIYALLDMGLFKYYRPLHMFPYPYKWLIGIGFYFFMKNQFKATSKVVFHKKEWYLFIPAIVYGLIRLYWFTIAVQENSFRITGVIVNSNFFRIHEFIYLFYTIIITLKVLQFINKNSLVIRSNKKIKHVKWLKKFTYVYLSVLIFNLLIYSLDLIIHNGIESYFYLYPTLIVNVAFIYWIGFIGFTKSNLIINEISITPNSNNKFILIEEKLRQEIEVNEAYKNPSLTIVELSQKLTLTTKEVSNYINEIHQMNFSEYLNHHRVQKVKELLISSDVEKYTLITLANEAGFSSKSSFNAEFKKLTGVTPSMYRKKSQHK
jgi:AraC-like DNA-binding protein